MFKKVSSHLTIDRLIYLFIILALLILWWPTKFLPSYWDSTGYAMWTADYFLQHNFHLPPPPAVSIHPPFYMYSLAAVWSLLGQNLFSAHLLNFIYSLIFFTSCYSIARTLFSWKIGVVFLVTLFVTPVFISQLGALYVDLPSASLSLAGVAAAEKKRWWLAGIFFSLAISTKITAAPFVAYFYLSALYHWRSLKKWDYFWIILPVLSFFAWIFIRHQTYGYWLMEKRLETVVSNNWSFHKILSSITAPLNEVFYYQHRWWILIALVWGFASLLGSITKKDRRQLVQSTKLFAMIGLTGILFGFASLYHTKYVMAAIAMALLLGLVFLSIGIRHVSARFNNQIIGYSIALILLSWFSYQSLKSWHPVYAGDKYRPIHATQEQNLSYQDMMKNWIQAFSFIQKNYPPQQLILGGFPELVDLRYPYAGYTLESQNIHSCQEFVNKEPISDAVIYLHPYSPIFSSCITMINDHDGVKVAEFENHGWWIELYHIHDSTSSANLPDQ